MAAPKTPDMQKCTPKERCQFGVNEGVAYDPADPCPEGYSFDTGTCSCVASEPCDCNCDAECPNCYFCNLAGECQPDPACGGPCCVMRVVRWTRLWEGRRQPAGPGYDRIGAYAAGPPGAGKKALPDGTFLRCAEQTIVHFPDGCNGAPAFEVIDFCVPETSGASFSSWALSFVNKTSDSECPCSFDWPGRPNNPDDYGHCPTDNEE